MTKIRTVSGQRTYTITGKEEYSSKNSGRAFKILIGILFAVYVCCVLYLVFFERAIQGSASRFHAVKQELTYIEQLHRYLQITPFHTIQKYADRLEKGNPLRRHAFINLAGNLILFFPMGFFLPYFSRKQRNPFWFILTMTIMISFVEVTQLLTLLGSCDIDDLILNLSGALTGFILFHILHVLYLIGRRFFYGRSKT